MNLLYPVPPESMITDNYADHKARGNGQRGGIDFAVSTGTPVHAAQAGTVTVSRLDTTGYGNHVRIDHGSDYLTLYAHLRNWTVKPGQRVKAGEVIAYSDGEKGAPGAGSSDGPHLHFELRIDDQDVNPAPYLNAALNEYPQPEPQPQPMPVPIDFPVLPKARVTSDIGLRIRQAAGTQYPQVGFLEYGAVVDVIRSRHDGADIWLQIGYQQWCAMLYQGDQLAVWVEPA